jgi:Tfp pilus assembly protein PilN
MIRTGVNLIPVERRHARRQRARTTFWAGAAILCALAWIAMLAVAQSLAAGDDRKLREELDRTSGELDKARAVVAALRSEIEQASALLQTRRAVGTQPDWSVLLAMLSSTMGERTVLRSVKLRAPHEATPAVTLELTGFAHTQREVSEFVLRLEQTPLFEKVKLIDTRREPFLRGSAIGFRVECELGARGEA